MIQISNYIDGQFCTSEKTLTTEEPAKGEIYATLPDSDHTDVDKAVCAAEKIFPYWSELSIEERIEWLLKISQIIEEHLDELAEWESRDNGKTITLSSTIDIPRVVKNFQFFAEYIKTQKDLKFDNEGFYNKTINYPLGVVSIISPWNFPLYLLTWKIAPALITGNTVVAKPSEITPMTAFQFSKLLDKINFPSGVINIVHGKGVSVGEPLVSHKKVKAISFTGSTATGYRIAELAGKDAKKVSLEMGGKNPNIIFEDCDFDSALETTLRSSFINNGQVCLCGSRVFLQEGIYKKFRDQFIEKAKNLKVGQPLDQDVNQGAIVSQTHFKKILSYLDLAVSEGGKILWGGKSITLDPPYDKGYFIQPTIIENLPNRCRTNQEEIFGPVVTLQKFSTEKEVLDLANDTTYGLSASIWSKDLEKAQRVASQIDAGIIWINTWMSRDLRTPFGGFKTSGLGREGGEWSLRFFTQPKNISWPKEKEE